MSHETSYPLSITLMALAAALASCQAPAPEPQPDKQPDKPASAQKGGGEEGSKRVAQPEQQQPPKRKISARPVANVEPAADDPLKGKFTLEDAAKGLPAGKELVATIETSMGNLECKLFADKAPITVANFVGLARGVRPWKTPEGKWEKKPAYDGTIFHRVIKGFMIQGGDAKKNGSGEPGYVIPDEIWEDANHDRAGLLCMANRGKNTNGAQFFITDAAAPHLDNGYTIFGECTPLDTIHKIAALETAGDRPLSPPDIKKVTISRK